MILAIIKYQISKGGKGTKKTTKGVKRTVKTTKSGKRFFVKRNNNTNKMYKVYL